MTITMAFAISTPTTSLLHSSSSTKPSSLCALSNSAVSIPKTAISQNVNGVPQLGFTHFSQLNGLKQLGIPISQYSGKKEKKGKCKGKGVYASLFGVGAPEALVIGVVALLVFGPKGLAEVARNLGKTLRAFQPTIRELQEVSRDFKSTLEREIGLDNIDSPVPKPSSSDTPKPTPSVAQEDSVTTAEPNGSPTESGEKTTQDYLQVSEARLKGALAQLQKEQDEEREREEKEREEKEIAELQPESSTPPQVATEAQDTQETASAVIPPAQSPESKPLQEAASVVPSASAPVPSPAPTLESES